MKFQKRNPDVCVPEHQKSIPRDTPWGTMSYLDYKYRMEFGKEEYDEIDTYGHDIDIMVEAKRKELAVQKYKELHMTDHYSSLPSVKAYI